MRRSPFRFAWAVAVLAVVGARIGWGQQVDEGQLLTRQLLNSRAPSADWQQVVAELRAKGVQGGVEELLLYWANPDRRWEEKGPESDTREKLLQAVEQRPQYLASILPYVPTGEAAKLQVKALYDRMEGDASWKGKERTAWMSAVKRWLMLNGYFEEELIKEAENPDEKYVASRPAAMVALIQLNWAKAEGILKQQAAGTRKNIAVAALGMLYEEHARRIGGDVEKERQQLKALVEDKKGGGFSRDAGLEALMRTEWEGRDAWYLGLFADETLQRVREGESTVLAPLESIVGSSPDYWIPRIIPLVAREGTLRNNAVECLTTFQFQEARADALRPLLPWLMDQEWSSAGGRLEFLHKLGRVTLPEAVPGLLHVLEKESYHRREAAEALAHHRVKEAGPLLRQAYLDETDRRDEYALAEALLGCEALSGEEMVEAIEAYARDNGAEAERQGFSQRVAVDAASKRIRLGHWLTNLAGKRGDVAARLAARAAELEKADPELAHRIAACMANWEAVEIDQLLVKQLEGKLSEDVIRTVLHRREKMSASVGDALRAIAGRRGAVAGVAAVVLDDEALQARMLGGMDTEAIEMMLACARLVRAPLPLDAVGRLMDRREGLIGMAAERYLVAEDSAAARQLVLAKRPGQMMILGARMGWDPGHETFGEFDKLEGKLRAEMRRNDGPEEIYALLSAGYWGGRGQSVIRIKGGEGVLRLEITSQKSKERPLSKEEVASIVGLVKDRRVEELPELDVEVHDGVQYEFVRLGKEGGRRVFMNNPGDAGSAGTAYEVLVKAFEDLAAKGKYTPHFEIAKRVAGVEVVFEGEEELFGVWARGGDIRVGEDKRVGDEREKSWRSIRNGQLAEGAEERPREWEDTDERDDVPAEGCRVDWDLNEPRWHLRVGDSYVRMMEAGNGRTGLFRCAKGKQPEEICNGVFGHPIVSEDGKWVVTTRPVMGWENPYQAVRINVANGEILPLDLPLGRGVSLTRVGGRIAINWNEEMWLVDPATGKSEVVAGDPEPLMRLKRPLQGTGKEGEVWAVKRKVPEDFSDENVVTTLGKYDLKTFTFMPVGEFPGLYFESDEMWVEGEKVYVVYRGDVLRMPVRGAR